MIIILSNTAKIVNINFQSIKNKKTELDILLDTTKPDVVIGTETWLDPTISSYEYFPQDQLLFTGPIDHQTNKV